jgi:hypothetical protein
MADDTLVHYVNWIDNGTVAYLVQHSSQVVERNVAATGATQMVARSGPHHVDLVGAFQIRVVGNAHTWLMAAYSSSRRQDWFHMLDRSSYFQIYHFHNVGRSCRTSLSNIQYDNM